MVSSPLSTGGATTLLTTGQARELKLMNWLSSTSRELISHAWCIQKRIIAICHEFLSGTKKDPDVEACPCDKSKLNAEILELGHAIQVEKESYNSVYKCGQCCQTWSAKTKRSIIDQGPCPGPKIWGGIGPIRHDRPQIAEAGCDIVYQ